MDVKLPNLGEGADSGVVVTLFVKEGDEIAVDQTILELENEKAVAPIPSTVAGKVTKIHVSEGAKISVGQRLISVEAAGGSPAPAETPAAAPAPKAAAAAPAPAPAVLPGTGKPPVLQPREGVEPVTSPSIRQMSRQLGIDLTRVPGSGNGGRITLDDLRSYLAHVQAVAFAPKEEAAPGAAPAKPASPSIDFSKWGPIAKRPMSPLRQVISRRMAENWNAIPHVTQFDDVDMTCLMDLRAKHKDAYAAQGAKLTVTPLILKAVVKALQQHPAFNSSLDEAAQEIIEKEYFHLGIAVDTEAGLIVPVIRDVNKKSVLQLADELTDLATRARDRKVSGEELKGGTFTISNQGAIGGAHFTPIVNKPEVAILGLGRTRDLARVVAGQVAVRKVMPIGISYDHRVIDGGTAARFTVDLVAALENFPEADVAL